MTRRASARLPGPTPATDASPKPEVSPTRKRRRVSTAAAQAETNREDVVKEEEAFVAHEEPIVVKEEVEKKPRKPRKPKVALEDEVWPERHWSSRKFVGAHVSSAGGADNAPLNACRIGAACFALFLKSQRQWTGPPLSEHAISRFPLLCDPPATSSRASPTDGKGFDFDRLEHVVPHGCYLVNLANPDQEKWAKAHAAFVEELLRAETLGIGKFNFHPGSTTGACSREEGIEWIAKGVNEAHKQTKSVKILIENMAGKGNMIGGTFEDLRDIIALVDDKSRVGVCLDTCHAFASGYDLRTKDAYESTMRQFADIVGFGYLGAVHVNDSKADLGSHRDLHENIGLGKLGLMPFLYLMNDLRFDRIPLILETVPLTRATQTPMLSGTLDPSTEPGGSGGVWVREIRMLHLLEGRTGEGDIADVEKLRDEVRGLVEEQERKEAEEKERKASDKASKKAKKKEAQDEDDAATVESPKKVKVNVSRPSRSVKVTTYEAESDSSLSDV